MDKRFKIIVLHLLKLIALKVLFDIDADLDKFRAVQEEILEMQKELNK